MDIMTNGVFLVGLQELLITFIGRNSLCLFIHFLFLKIYSTAKETRLFVTFKLI